MEIKENKKGFSLYMIIIMMSVLLAVVFGLATSIIGGINLAVILGDSVNAFYAADAGVERALYRISNNNCERINEFHFAIDYPGTYEIEITPNDPLKCKSGGKIKSTGTYNNAKKRIEVSY
jgi:hypothetical protein